MARPVMLRVKGEEPREWNEQDTDRLFEMLEVFPELRHFAKAAVETALALAKIELRHRDIVTQRNNLALEMKAVQEQKEALEVAVETLKGKRDRLSKEIFERKAGVMVGPAEES